MKDAKPCPWCSGTADLIMDRHSHPRGWAVHCIPCKAFGPVGATREIALLVWNSRHERKEAK